MPRFALAALVLALGASCLQDASFEDPPCPESQAVVADDFTIALTTAPQHGHIGDVIAFTFSVSRADAPVEGLTPAAAYEHQATGATGTIKLTAGAPGEYTGSRAFFTAGDYSVSLDFKEGSSTISRSFSITVEGH